MDGVFMRKWELSIVIAAAVTLLWCAVSPHWAMRWWTTAFAPLCDGLLSAGEGVGEVMLRSKLWELVSAYF